jgi:SAM-dependent methyltransferase
VSVIDPYASRLGRLYAFSIEHPSMAWLVGKLGWGTSFRALYRSLADLGNLPSDVTVLDACCGAGLALRTLDPSIQRYVGIDRSAAMLDRARGAAERRRFGNAGFSWQTLKRSPCLTVRSMSPFSTTPSTPCPTRKPPCAKSRTASGQTDS